MVNQKTNTSKNTYRSSYKLNTHEPKPSYKTV